MRCAHVPRQHQGCIQRRLNMVWIGTSTVGREGRGRSPLDETETPSSLSCQCLFLPRANRADKGAMPVKQQRSPLRAVSAWTHPFGRFCGQSRGRNCLIAGGRSRGANACMRASCISYRPRLRRRP